MSEKEFIKKYQLERAILVCSSKRKTIGEKIADVVRRLEALEGGSPPPRNPAE